MQETDPERQIREVIIRLIIIRLNKRIMAFVDRLIKSIQN